MEQTIRDVESGRMEIPLEADVPTFLLSDGKLSQACHIRSQGEFPEEEASILVPTLGDLFSEFFDALPSDAVESSTQATMHTPETWYRR